MSVVLATARAEIHLEATLLSISRIQAVQIAAL
jgi:hypothetical protein